MIVIVIVECENAEFIAVDNTEADISSRCGGVDNAAPVYHGGQCMGVICVIVHKFIYLKMYMYFNTIGWVFSPVKTVSHITYTVLAGT